MEKYKKRASGPILDRIDLHVEVPEVDLKEFAENQKTASHSEPSSAIRDRVQRARTMQIERFSRERLFINSEMKNSHVKKYAFLSSEAEKLLIRGALQYKISARSYIKMIKIARTIADLDQKENILTEHIAEAFQYRPKSYEAN